MVHCPRCRKPSPVEVEALGWQLLTGYVTSTGALKYGISMRLRLVCQACGWSAVGSVGGGYLIIDRENLDDDESAALPTMQASTGTTTATD